MPSTPSTTADTAPIIYLDLALGNESAYNTSSDEYQTVVDWYEKNRQIYGFEEDKSVDELDEVGGELLKGCFEAENVRLFFLDVPWFIFPSFSPSPPLFFAFLSFCSYICLLDHACIFTFPIPTTVAACRPRPHVVRLLSHRTKSPPPAFHHLHIHFPPASSHVYGISDHEKTDLTVSRLNDIAQVHSQVNHVP